MRTGGDWFRLARSVIYERQVLPRSTRPRRARRRNGPSNLTIEQPRTWPRPTGPPDAPAGEKVKTDCVRAGGGDGDWPTRAPRGARGGQRNNRKNTEKPIREPRATNHQYGASRAEGAQTRQSVAVEPIVVWRAEPRELKRPRSERALRLAVGIPGVACVAVVATDARAWPGGGAGAVLRRAWQCHTRENR